MSGFKSAPEPLFGLLRRAGSVHDLRKRDRRLGVAALWRDVWKGTGRTYRYGQVFLPTNSLFVMNRFFYSAALAAALLLMSAGVTAGSLGNATAFDVAEPSLADHLQASTGEARGQALQNVIHLANFDRARLDVPTLMPVLFSIARADENPQYRAMAGQAIATLGTRADARQLARIARRDASPWASRQMQLAAATALRG